MNNIDWQVDPDTNDIELIYSGEDEELDQYYISLDSAHFNKEVEVVSRIFHDGDGFERDFETRVVNIMDEDVYFGTSEVLETFDAYFNDEKKKKHINVISYD